MYALVLNESRILKWEGRNKERRTKSTKKKRREKDEFNEEEKSKKQKQRWTHREANKTKTLEVKNKQQSPAHSLSVSPDTSLSKFILPGQLHTLFVQPCWQRQVHSQKAAVFTSHLFISATKASKHASKHATVS